MRSIRATLSGRRDPRRSTSPVGIAFVVALGVATTGCSRSLAAPISADQHGDEQPRRGGTLHVASYKDVRNLDPAGPGDGLAAQAQHLIFAGLVDFDDREQIVPDLADHWDIDDGGRSYRFVLRQGVIMQDGEELTADDVKRSIERALHPTSPNPDASYYEGIEGYAAYTSGKAEHLDGVTVDARYVVTFHLTDPDATFLSILALLPSRPVCRTAGNRYVDTWTPCGAGPFKLAMSDWQRGESLVLRRYDRYFRPGLPLLDAVEFTYNIEFLSQRLRFEAGELDVLHDMTAADQARFAKDPRWKAFGHIEADTTVYGESMNTKMPPFDNVEVRRAVAAAIDRDHYRLLKPAYMTPLTQAIPPDVPGFDGDVAGQHYDYAAALEHMKKAGLPYDPVTGRGGWPKPIVYPLYDQGLLVYTAQILQQELAKIGLHLELRLVSWQAFLALQQRPGGAAISQGNWAMDYPDASSFFEPLFTTSSIGPESSFNTSFYSDNRFDALVAQARREMDPARRKALYREANSILCDEAPWAFTYSYHWFSVIQPYVRGPLLHPVWFIDPTRTWLDRGAAAIDDERGKARR